MCSLNIKQIRICLENINYHYLDYITNMFIKLLPLKKKK